MSKQCKQNLTVATNSVHCVVLQAFSVVFEKAIDRAEASEEIKQRVINLIDCITFSVFMYTSRGLFERDKLIFLAQMTFQVSDCTPAALISLLTFSSMFLVWRSFSCILTSDYMICVSHLFCWDIRLPAMGIVGGGGVLWVQSTLMSSSWGGFLSFQL